MVGSGFDKWVTKERFDGVYAPLKEKYCCYLTPYQLGGTFSGAEIVYSGAILYVHRSYFGRRNSLWSSYDLIGPSGKELLHGHGGEFNVVTSFAREKFGKGRRVVMRSGRYCIRMENES
jgi:hypothetical protein